MGRWLETVDLGDLFGTLSVEDRRSSVLNNCSFAS